MKNGGSESSFIETWWRERAILFNTLSKETFTDIPLQFHIELRINGEYLMFDKDDGCNSLKFMKKKSVIANSITCTPSKYTDEEMSSFLDKNLALAFTQIIGRIAKEKIHIEDEKLLSHF